jgi:3-oxoacyl-[acyl-carrier-protein] synthase II
MSSPLRVVITGIGAVSAFGWGVDALRKGLQSGKTAITEAKSFNTDGHRTRVAGEAPDAPPELKALFADWNRFSRADQFAVGAGLEAARQAQLVDPAHCCGVYFGSSTAGMLECEEYVARLLKVREGYPRLGQLASQQLNGPGDALARALGVTGPVQSFSTACASGPLAVGAARDALCNGEVEAALTGGADSLCQLTYGGFNSLRAVDKRPSRPFRKDHSGLSLGEGAGVLVVEGLEHAVGRGARPLAEVLGFGASCDAHHMTAPQPEGDGALAAMRAALADAGIEPRQVGFLNTHGTGTPHNDEAEARACARLLEERLSQVPVSATKAAVGHLLGAAGALEAVATVLALMEGAVHPTPGGGEMDAELGLDLVVGEARELENGAVAISTNLAFGGANAALVLRAWNGETA